MFRPLTKNKYLIKRKERSVAILAKGRALFPDVKPLISAGGGAQSVQRVMEVSRIAALMEEHGIPAVAEVQKTPAPVFIPSACWRNIAPGILSTTRFTGMVLAGQERLAVYDIGDGNMEWQVRAEGSLFYTKYGSYETRATGMILICQDGKRNKTARNIIRQTMWSRRRLLSDVRFDTSSAKPVAVGDLRYGNFRWHGAKRVPCPEAELRQNDRISVTLTIDEPLPSMKRMTEAIEEHWKAMLHAAIEETAQQRPLPYFDKAMVEIEIVTPRGSNNAKLWDTSNRAINVIINNLKGIFFEDDNMEHMAFSVVGRWGEKGVTIIRVLDFDESRQIRGIT